MSKLNGVAELLARVDECLAADDWERLAGLEAPPMGSVDADDDEIRAALAQIQAMQHRLQERLEAVGGELDSVPELLTAAKAYLSH